MDQSFMKTKKVVPLVASMALPMALSMLVNALYNIVDSFFIAQISEKAMTALSLIFPLQNVTTAVGVGLGVGTNAAVAFFLGGERKQEAQRAASAALLLSLVNTAILMAVLLPLTGRFLRQFTADAQVLDYGVRYGRIVFVTVFVGQAGLVYEKLFQAVGRVRISMASMMAGCIANMILDPVMIFGIGPCPAMGIEGAAAATVIGQALSLAVYLVLDARGFLGIGMSLRTGVKGLDLAGRIYRVGVPVMLSCALPSVMITVMNAILAACSASGVLILGVYYKLQTFIYLSANGIVQGIRPLVAYNYGARLPKRVKAISRIALVMSAAVMAAGTAVCLLFPAQLMGMFTDNKETIREGAGALRVISAGFIVSSVSVTMCGVLEGLGFGTWSFVINLMRYVVLILPAAFILSRFFGSAGVWNAFWVAEAASAAVAAWMYRKAAARMERTAA